MKRRTKIALLVVGLLLALGLGGALWIIVDPPAYLPHERIVLGLPFSPADAPDSMIPMGETIYHPKPAVPNGHPGIDFGWLNDSPHAMLAAADGVVTRVQNGSSEPGKIDLESRHGVYLVRYKEMDDASGLRVGQAVRAGDVVGHAGRSCDEQHCWYNVHWELASVSLVLDRWCPLTYFTPDARAAMEQLWERVPSTDKVKSQFPDVCSGDYAGKAEPV